MKCTVELSEAEKKTLQQLSLKHPYQDFRLRGQGLLLLSDGRRVEDVAQQLDVSMKSVYNWSHWWRDKGLCGLLVGHQGGRPRALSEAMVAMAVELARAESLGLREIAQRLEAAHGALPCRLETLGQALRREGFSYKRGRYSLKKSRTPRNLP